MKIKALSHVGITVSNLERSIVFYKDVLKFKLVVEPGTMCGGPEIEKAIGVPESTHRTCMMELSNGQRLELMEFGELCPRKREEIQLNHQGTHHVAYLVDDMEECVHELTEKGLSFFSAPLTEPYEAGELSWVLFRDPDGIIIELIEIR